jgi:glycosyltransferase involved in cell wall biosynthesis
MTRSVLVANPSADVYGSDRMMLEAVRGLVADGWEVVVAASVDGPLAGLVEQTGARFVVVPSPVVRKSHLSAGGLLQLAASVTRGIGPMVHLIREVRPDVVYVNTLSIPFWLAVAAVMRVPSVNHVHEAETSLNPLARVGLELPTRLASRVIFNSETSRAATRLGRGRAARGARVVHNGVAAPPAVPAPRRSVDAPRLAYLGRLSPRKGVDVAIATVSELVDRGVHCTLTIVGDTFPGYEWYERELREQVQTAGLGDRVTFAGFVPRVWPVLADIDILLVPSRGEESFGNVVIEAALSGRPVVASNHSGLQEAMSALRAAVPVPVDDPRAMADAVQRVMTDWTQMSAQAAEDAADVRERFAPARFQRELVAVLDDLVGEGRDDRSRALSIGRPVASMDLSHDRSRLTTAKGENP